MKVSFLLNNKDSNRPPLLLPSLPLSSYSTYYNPINTTLHSTTTTTTTTTPTDNNDNTLISSNPLDNLATLATIIPKLAVNNDNDSITNYSANSNPLSSTTIKRKRKRTKSKVIDNIDIITPPPTKPATPSPSKDINIPYLANDTIEKHVSYPSKYYQKLADNDTSSKKRQRVGPSCDKCRIKKIKCNASIEVILKDTRIVGMFNEHLHYILTDHDIETYNKKWSHIFGVKLPSTICNIPTPTKNGTGSNTKQQQEYQVVVKHLDKLIIFRPCTSCLKRKYKNSEFGPMSCKFARGFSRSDINQFNRIKIHMASLSSSSSSSSSASPSSFSTVDPSVYKNMPIYDLTIRDYQIAGFPLVPLQ